MSAKAITHLALATVLLLSFSLSAKENVGSSGKTAVGHKAMAATCSPASAQIDLDINNVRTTLLNGGDLWWDLNDARYEIPKIDPPGSAPSVHSLFAGAIWLGGIDVGGQLKIAAQTYRQSGSDFWPGPLDDNGSVDDAVCQSYDRHWKVLGSEIDQLKAAYTASATQTVPESEIPQSLKDWPARGNINAKGASNSSLVISRDLAPFFDQDGDLFYDPSKGDHPAIDSDDPNGVYADQMIFWVYNDKGDIHSETGGQAIGVQINALAFAFATSDEVNDMTFYRYNIANRASLSITNFYMGQWVDPDLGCFNNDYVGCDTTRELGICYNGTTTDPDCASRGYGENPPLIGIDYFEGPFADINFDDSIPLPDGTTIASDPAIDGLDNDGDGDVDEKDERRKLGMSTFTYYNNDFTVTGNPESAVHFYNYMIGFWKDNTPFTSDQPDAYGGTVPTKYMFPSDPSQSPFPDFWSECSVNNPPADRRFLQSSGPFTLEPGADNTITVGAVWTRPTGFACGASSFDEAIGAASDKAQALFDNGFKLLDGPDAPTLVIRELDKEIIISLVNAASSNNVNESYDEVDPVARAESAADPSITDTTFSFQGYKLYQLINAQVTASEVNDVSKARLVAQVDIKDEVDKLVNFEFDASLGADIPSLEVDGANEGISRSFQVLSDLFATGSNTLVNHQTYYFAAIAYSYNNYIDYDPLDPLGGGQKIPYLQGRRNYKIYSAIPHQEEIGRGGTILHAQYGDGVEITRHDGAGNGGQNVDLTDSTTELILRDGYYKEIVYEAGMGPIDVKVVDPFKVKNVDFKFYMMDSAEVRTGQSIYDSIIVDNSAYWRLEVFNEGTMDQMIFSDRDIEIASEQLIEDYGISIGLGQVGLNGRGPDDDRDEEFVGYIPGNGFIEATIEYDDPEEPWLAGIQDEGTFAAENWIRCGQYRGPEPQSGDPPGFDGFFDDHAYTVSTDRGIRAAFYDPGCEFGNAIGGTWTPYGLATNWINQNLVDATPRVWNTPYSYGPAFPIRFRRNFTQPQGFLITESNLDRLHSVDVVFTSDKDKWTRCVVIETGEDAALNEGGAAKGSIRMRESWDPLLNNGEGGYIDPNRIDADTGRSWFPGYAINVETGERLNMMFGEDSWLTGENGRDMIWNPTSNERSPLRQIFFGGKHFIYVMKSRYDEGEKYKRLLQENFNNYERILGSGQTELVRNAMHDSIFSEIMWVSAPLLEEGAQLTSVKNGIIPNDVKIRLRVNTPYSNMVVENTNDGNPEYSFSTVGMGAETDMVETAKGACDEIRVVPNPYYAYGGYENSQLDTKVKITNLPDRCTVSIFTLGGTLIRQYKRAIGSDTSEGSSTETTNLDNSLDWNLKNDKNIPISSGLYIIHVQADGVCERVIKWFGVLRPTDLDTF